jgi:hypothetical protein
MATIPDSDRDLLDAQVATLATVGKDGAAAAVRALVPGGR